MRSLLFTVCLLGVWLLPAGARAQDAGAQKPCQARTLYVAELGGTDEAARFRRALAERLARKFKVVQSEGEADAVLTAAVKASGNSRSGEVHFENGVLKSSSGDVLWQGNFQYYYKKSFFGPSIINDSASGVAKNIRDACKR